MINNSKLTIIIVVFTISFIGYNVLTAEAKEYHDRDKDEYVGRETPDENSDVESYEDDTRERNEEYCEDKGFYENNEKFCDDLVKFEDTYEYEDEQGSKQICEDNFGEWKGSECHFSKDEKKKGYDVDFDHSMEEEGLWDNYALKQRDKKLENICDKVDGKWTKDGCVTDSDGPKADKFNELVDKEPGATIQDGEYGVIPFQIPAAEPEEDVYEGKRYVNPDGGAPLYEDELTEDEKEYYEEYKPEKEEEPPVIEDWRNEVNEESPPAPPEQEDYKIGSPIVVEQEDNEDLPNTSGYQYSEPANEESEESSDEYKESSYEEEESEEEEEESSDESEDNSDSESEPDE